MEIKNIVIFLDKRRQLALKPSDREITRKYYLSVGEAARSLVEVEWGIRENEEREVQIYSLTTLVRSTRLNCEVRR